MYPKELDIKVLILKEKPGLSPGSLLMTIFIIANWATNSAIDKFVYMKELAHLGT